MHYAVCIKGAQTTIPKLFAIQSEVTCQRVGPASTPHSKSVSPSGRHPLRPAFFAPIEREPVAHQPVLDARIAQHRVAGGFAAVKIGEVVGFEYRSATFDLCVVAIDILAGDQENAGLVPGRTRERRPQGGLARRPPARAMPRATSCRTDAASPARQVLFNLRERRAGLISSTVGDGILEQPEPAREVFWIDRAQLAHRLFDFVAAVERARRHRATAPNRQ